MAADVSTLGIDRGRTRQQLPEEVATYVRELIVSGGVRPGEFLRMDRIAEAVGVSNTPVREGLLALRSEGFVRQVPRRGFVVEPFSQQDIRDLFWVQGVLAGELAARAAKTIDPDRLDRLEKIVQQYGVARHDDDQDAIGSLGHFFHREVNLASGSNRLALILGSVVKHLPNRFYATIDGQVAATHDEHPLIIEALRERNEKKARGLMEKHIVRGADRLIETLQQRGYWSDAAS